MIKGLPHDWIKQLYTSQVYMEGNVLQSCWCILVYNKLSEGAKLKSSLKNINWNMRSRLEPHHVWTTVDPNTKDVQRAAVKPRMITGTYMLQEQKAKFYHDQDASCPLCNQESETLEHFLLRCQQLDKTRQSHLQQVREAVIFGYAEEIWDRLQTQELY